MTVREQLAGHVGRIRSAWDRSPPAGPDFAVEGFRLESPSVVLPVALIRRFSRGGLC